jgi:hypothetical protein
MICRVYENIVSLAVVHARDSVQCEPCFALCEDAGELHEWDSRKETE